MLDISILILLDSLLLSNISMAKTTENLGFQSLFYWILFFYNLKWKLVKKRKLGFNPYSTGFSSFIVVWLFCWLCSTRSFNPYSTGFSSFILRNIIISLKKIEFQSLFYWILFFYNTPHQE